MSRGTRLHGWICWGIIVGSWAALTADWYQTMVLLREFRTEHRVDAPAWQSVKLPVWVMALACVATTACLVASVRRRTRACMRMRPRLSRPSVHGDTYLEAFALESVLLVGLAACVCLIDWDLESSDRFELFLVLGVASVPVVAAAYVFARCRSFRVPLAEWGWRWGSGALREISIGVVAGTLIWSIRSIPRAVLEPDAAVLGLFSPDSTLRVLQLVVWVPIVEETLYRGMLYRHLRDHLRWSPARWSPAVVINAAVFALMHVDPARWTLVFASGLVYALLREWRGSLIAPIAAHASFNLMAIAAGGTFNS